MTIRNHDPSKAPVLEAVFLRYWIIATYTLRKMTEGWPCTNAGKEGVRLQRDEAGQASGGSEGQDSL